MKTYFISPLNKRALVSKRRWTKSSDSIFEYCRWVDGSISISVPSEDRDFDPYIIIMNADNEWKRYAYKLIEGYDGNIEWVYGNHFECTEWQILATQRDTDLREELQKRGWIEGAQELFIDGKIELDASESQGVRNNHNLEW